VKKKEAKDYWPQTGAIIKKNLCPYFKMHEAA
jgi:hypothetical protein